MERFVQVAKLQQDLISDGLVDHMALLAGMRDPLYRQKLCSF